MRRISKVNLLGLSFAGFGLAAAAHAVPMGTAMVGGLLQADLGSFSGDKAGVSRTSADIRRAEIWIKGNLTHDWSYQLGYDARFTRLDTSWVGYAGFEPIWVAMGLVNVPQSLEAWSGPVNSTFMEYASAVQAFQPVKGVGVYVDGSASDDQLSYQAAVYMPNYQTADVEEDGYAYAQEINTVSYGDSSEDVGASLRVTLNQDNLMGFNETLHVGASIRYDGVSESQQINPYVGTPGVLGKANADVNNILVSSVIPLADDIKSVNTYGLEAAGIWNSLLLQGELLKPHVNGADGSSSLSFLGYYGQVAYVLTGETRSYDQYSGTVGGVDKPANPYGAWEIAFRYGYLDLSDDADVGYEDTDKRGKQQDYTLGINWYVNQNVRFLGNYVVACADYAADVEDATVKSFGLRAQVDF